MSSIESFKYVDTLDRNEYYNNVLKLIINEKSITNEDLCYLLEQVVDSIPKDEITFSICKSISVLQTTILSKLFAQGYIKFQVVLVELADRHRSHLDSVKLSSKNVYTSDKKLAVICLSSLFAKFGGFLNSFKISLLNVSYKHLKKLADNTAREFDASYFSQFLLLIDVLLSSSPNLNSQTFQRMLKLYKIVKTRGKTYVVEKEGFNYSILSVIYANNILTTLLRSPFYINSITTKKQHNPLFYLNSISPYLSYLISCTNTRFRNLRLSATKNVTNLLIFSYVNYGIDDNETRVFNFTFNYLWEHYMKLDSNNKVKIGVLEILMQFMSNLNLIFETGILPNSKNFISFKSFEILELSLTKVFTHDPEANVLSMQHATNFTTCTTVLNHLTLFYKHLLKEVRSDVNKLIILQHLFDDYLQTEGDNSYKVISLLQLSQLIVNDLGQYILTHDSKKMEETLLFLTKNSNPYIRILSIQILTQLNIDIDGIISESFGELTNLFNSKQNEQQDTFIRSHSTSLLVSSILSSSSSVSTDLILSILSLSNSILKKFNSNVLINNLINGNDYSTLSNSNYEKQISSWILMMGLFNYYQHQKIPFLLANNPLLNIWKTLLAHNVPSGFIKIDNGEVSNFNELMKFIEIKNYSLSCLVCFIDYAISLNSLPIDFVKQLAPLLTKCYSFITNIEHQLSILKNSQLTKTIQIQKLRILTNFVKIIPHLIKLTDEVNISTDLLLSVVKNFNDHKIFAYKLGAESTKSTKIKETATDYDIYRVDDGLAFGLTTKINLFQTDELLFKNESDNRNAVKTYEIDVIPGSSNFIIENKDCKSHLSPVSQFDELESLLYQSVQPSILNDYLFSLITNNRNYSNTKESVVPVERATVDLSIELFQLVFPYLSLKIQQSILEHIRTGILHSPEAPTGSNSADLTSTADRAVTLNDSFSYERQRAVIINSSVAIHGMLNHLSMKESSHLKLNRMIVNLIIETMKRTSTKDLLVINLNAESIGLSLSVLDEPNIKLVNESVNYFINTIVEKDDPFIRAFSTLCFGYIFKYNARSMNAAPALDVLLKLLLDPHPIVHHWSLEGLILILENYHDYGGSSSLISDVLSVAETVYASDEFGLNSKSSISSNLNLTFEGSDKNVLLAKIARVLIKIVGPGIKTLPERKRLQSLILKISCFTTTNYDFVARELIVLFDEASIFDNSFVGEDFYHKFLKFIYLNNIKTGVYSENLVALPLIDNMIGSPTSENEIFQINSSNTLLNLAINSLHQIVRVSTSTPKLYETLDEELQGLLWTFLESDNVQVFKIFKLWMDIDFHSDAKNEFKIKWVEDLISKFNFTEKELYKPLNNLFRQKFNASPSLFTSKAKQSAPIKQGNAESRLFGTQRNGTEDAEGEGENDENDSDISEEASAINTGNVAEEVTASVSNIEREDSDNVEVKGAKAQNIADEEPVRWQFKYKALELIQQLLSYSKEDEFLFRYLSTRLSELVRISFVASTSQILKLRSAGLKLLGTILTDYVHVKDPLYENLSILDQQQAQIISAILPAFGKDSSIELICEGFEVAGILIGSGLTSLSRLQRLVRILVTSLYDLSLLMANKKSDSSLKIGEVSVKTTKEQNRITLAVLDSWAKLKISCSESNEELTNLLNEHLKVLASLWVYSLKQYSMIKYGKQFMEGETTSIEIYVVYWQSLVMAISKVVRDDPDLIESVLGAELNNFFFAIFGQCIEILFKSSAPNSETLTVLKNILSLRAASSILYHDSVFEELIDLFDRLSSNLPNDAKLNLIDIISELYVSYFESKSGITKSEEDLHSEVDKLFELLRLIMSYVNNVLPFIQDQEIKPEKLKTIEDSDVAVLKKSFSILLMMIEKLPSVIQIDLYSCLLFMFSLIYQLDNNEIIGVILPSLKKVLQVLSQNNQEELLSKFYKLVEPSIRANKSQNSLITYMIFATTSTKNLILQDEDYELIAGLLIESLQSEKSAAIATMSIKSVIVQKDNGNASYILRKLFPKLIDSVVYNRVDEPRIAIELVMIFVKSITDDSQFLASLSLLVPLLIWFSKNDKSYSSSKFIDLIRLKPDLFKKFVSEEVSSEEKRNIEELVKHNYTDRANGIGGTSIEQGHIDLKMFGAN